MWRELGYCGSEVFLFNFVSQGCCTLLAPPRRTLPLSQRPRGPPRPPRHQLSSVLALLNTRGTHAVGSCLATARRKSGFQNMTVGFSSPLCSPVWFQKFTMHCPIPQTLTGSAALSPELHRGPAPLLGAPRAGSWGAVGLWGGQPHVRLFSVPHLPKFSVADIAWVFSLSQLAGPLL